MWHVYKGLLNFAIANIMSTFNFCYSWTQIIETLKEFKYQSFSTLNFCYLLMNERIYTSYELGM